MNKLISCCLLIFVALNNAQKFDVVKVTVYYDANGESSQRFITEQLVPAYEVLGDRIILDLVPYALRQPNNGRFPCGRRNRRCLPNIIEACAFSQTTNSSVQLAFADCMVNQTRNATQLQACANETGLDYNDIEQCAEGQEGYALYVNNGFKVNSVFPHIYRLPTVTINGVVPTQRRAENSFLALVCSYLNNPPAGCNQNGGSSTTSSTLAPPVSQTASVAPVITDGSTTTTTTAATVGPTDAPTA